jgi:hypothetical protein
MGWRVIVVPTQQASDAKWPKGVPIGGGFRTDSGILMILTPGGWANLANHQIGGEGPTLTVAPSIQVSRREGVTYHGHIQNGVLTDDCDGRTFPQHPGNT